METKSLYSFEEKTPEIGEYISVVWEDGSDCDCIYDGLDKTILPLPTHWYYPKLTLNKPTDEKSIN